MFNKKPKSVHRCASRKGSVTDNIKSTIYFYQMTNKSLFQSQVRGSVLFRQYYPEGGWGWVVVFVGALMISFTQVHISSHILLLHLRESICLLEFWSSQRFGGSGDSSSAAAKLKQLVAGPPSSPMSRLPPSPSQCQGNALYYLSFYNYIFQVSVFVCDCHLQAQIDQVQPSLLVPFCWTRVT